MDPFQFFAGLVLGGKGLVYKQGADVNACIDVIGTDNIPHKCGVNFS